MASYWRSVQGVLETVFKRKVYLNFKIMCFRDLEELCLAKCDKYLLRFFLVACKKAITRKWIKKDTPTIKEWIDLVYNIFTLERITFKGPMTCHQVWCD